MKPTHIKDLIKQLEIIQKNHGNIEVWVEVPNPDDQLQPITAERISRVNICHIQTSTEVCYIHAQPA